MLAFYRSEEVAQKMKQEAAVTTASPLGSLGKPLKTCIGCSKCESEMLKCSKCKRVFACSNVCFSNAWHAHHKHVCQGAKK
jgi:ferredoxin